MITTPSMGLKRWDQPNDVFSYVELSDNFAALDNHDHTSGKGVQIPTAGIANLAVDSTKLATDSVTVTKIPVASVTGDRLVNSTVLDTKIASPNSAVYRTIHSGAFWIGTGGAGPFAAGSQGTALLSGLDQSTGSVVIIPWTAANYAVAGKTTKMRLMTSVGVNTVAPAANVSFGLSPVTAVGGGSSNQSATFSGTFVTGSGITINTPTVSTRYTSPSADFDIPADGYYTFAITNSVTTAAGTRMVFTFELQIRHV